MTTRAARRTRARGAPPTAVDYDLVLYISGATEHSRTALANIKFVVEKHLPGRHRLTVVDLYQQPELAREHDVMAVPMLVRKLPLPLRRMIGDLSKEDRVLIGLDLVALTDS